MPAKLEEMAHAWFNNDASLRNGLPTVQHFPAQLHLSPSYVSDMLRSLTGAAWTAIPAQQAD